MTAWLTTARASLGPSPSKKAATPPSSYRWRAVLRKVSSLGSSLPPSATWMFVLTTSIGYTGTHAAAPATAPPMSGTSGAGSKPPSSSIARVASYETK